MTTSNEVRPNPVLPIRELYCPSHFGNSYEVAGPREMRALLSEARFWGFNRYADWFDTVDLRNPYAKNDGLFDMPEAVWAHKFSSFTTAADLGFDLGLVVTPNHVFSEQVTPGNAAETLKGRYFGQLVCPAKPGVEAMILGNYRRLFEDFSSRGLALSAISFGAYDYGGCNCPACQPWIVTFGKLAQAIADLARESFPEVRTEIWAWWWTDEDHEMFTAWADKEAPGYFASLAHHLPYDTTAYAPRPVPKGCNERAFLHIGYGETRGRDVYGHYGPSVGASRLETTLRGLVDREAEGFLAYSEGVCDDVNKAIAAGLASAQYATADEVLRAYAERYLGGDAGGWAPWLRALGEIHRLDPVRARREFDRLARDARPSWRLDAFEAKLIMREHDAAVESGQTWDESRLASAEAFWAEKERLWRKVWGLGLGRHAFKLDWVRPAWHEEYLEALGNRARAEAQPEVLDEA